MERPEKRKRAAAASTEEHPPHSSSCTSCWMDAVAWIQSNGGTVHPALTFSSSVRSVQTQTAERTKEDDGEERKGDGTIPCGTVLMRIPSPCLLTVDAVSSTPVGGKLVDVVRNNTSSDPLLKNDASDLILALYMAHISSSKDNTNSRHAAYLATLPPPSSYDNIARRWDDTQLESLLGGTALLARVRTDRSNLMSDYKVISSAWSKMNGTEESAIAFPSFEQFDDMFAAVSSRGFAGLGSDDGQSDAMVPLLDLLDHRRGCDAKKDVRYNRCSAEGGANSCIEVVADRDLPPGSTLHDTYGAKGNSQLLSRYGFCIANNLEPDGSSNDVVELLLKEGQPVVGLRAGPKSYTYGKLVRMVDMFQEQDGGDDGANGQEDVPVEDDMEAFLNQCDEEEAGDGDNDDDDNGFDMMMYGGDGGMNDDEEEDEEKMLESECKALEDLSAALGKARNRYSLKGEVLKGGLAKGNGSPEHFAAILVQSEKRTMRLYQMAVDKIRHRLMATMNDNSSPESSEAKNDGNDDDEDLMKQVNELVSAYATIRHGGLM